VRFEEQELYQELGLSQERRRIAVRSRDYEVLREDELATKALALRAALKLWLADQRAGPRRPQWLR
jgi:hypothetical protein